jgi:hypothetical protein
MKVLRGRGVLSLYLILATVMFLSCSGGGGGGGGGGGDNSTDTTAPGKITLTGLSTASTGSVTLTWTDPADTDFDHVEISCSNGGTASVPGGTQAYTRTGLAADTEYTFSVKSADETANLSEAYLLYVKVFSAGDKDYILIDTADKLGAIAGTGDTDYPLDGNYILTADIDLTSYGPWAPIGDNTTPFTGIFIGNNHTVSGVTINSPGDDYKGLFGYIEGGDISHLALTGVSISGDKYTGGLAGYNDGGTLSDCSVAGDVTGSTDYTGGLIGYNDNSTLSNCYSTAIVSGHNRVGGLVGLNDNSALSNCYATGAVSGSDVVGGLLGRNYNSTLSNCYTTGNVTGNGYVGGLSGTSWQSSTLSGCYATGDVTGSNNYVGGLVGSTGSTDSCTLSNCYATGAVSGSSDVGGLVGQNSSTLSNCYATGAVSGSYDVGGLVGTNNNTVSNSFYDTNTTGMSDNGKGTQKTTAEMKTGTTFTDAGWDFAGETANGSDDIWDIGSSINSGYPYLSGNAP